ncbi:FAD-dependent oxidoreductase [Marivivens sp. LCG002]|uniref:NAD(P)/FAD-dependent oxidoreductase n=1 Tax=Marivivens sp. LCG002 TaxID=3051171 RepID=UPI0025578448|nr:FAD-dependent oxidoreductase [Marivivens sp. LCG002]WIV50591.1 FAD-dependent oxidoreductase [Marivivens sp. LCG002]
MKKLVVIGAGMASGRLLDHLTREHASFEVTLFNAEPRGTYNRIMLSSVLAGEKNLDEIITHPASWYEARGITCRFGEKVIGIDPKGKTVFGEKGPVRYDKLVIATGSSSFIIPIEGCRLDGVIGYRDVEDTLCMIESAGKSVRDVVVIGGGVLGLEAAAGLRARGAHVTVLHNTSYLMNRQLDEVAAGFLRSAIEARGISVICGAKTQGILGDYGKVTAVEVEGISPIKADLVVMAAGIRPNVDLAKAAGLDKGRAIKVSASLQTSDPDIYALGECIEFQDQTFGLVAPIFEQAKVLSERLLGRNARFEIKKASTKLKVTGCDLFSAGDFDEDEGTESLVYTDPLNAQYRKVVLKENRVHGVVLYGDTRDGNWFFDLVQSKTDISSIRDTLLFGPAYQDLDLASADPQPAEQLRAIA